MPTDLDQGGLLGQLVAGFELQIGGMREEQARTNRRLEQLARPPAAPVFHRAVGQVVADANGFGVISLGGPQQGLFWYLRRWTAGGTDPSIVSAGIADLFVSHANLAAFKTIGAIGMNDWVDEFPVLPNIADYGAGSYPLNAKERAFVVIRSGTVGQTYVATAGVTEYQWAASQQTWDV